MIKNILIPRVTLPTRRPPSNSSRAASSNNSSSSRTYLPTESQVCQCQCRCQCQGRNFKCCRLFMPWQNREKRDNEECFLVFLLPFFRRFVFSILFFFPFSLSSGFHLNYWWPDQCPAYVIFWHKIKLLTIIFMPVYFIYSITDYVFKKRLLSRRKEN